MSMKRINQKKSKTWSINMGKPRNSIEDRVSNVEYILFFSVLAYFCIDAVKRVTSGTWYYLVLLILFLVFGIIATVYLGKLTSIVVDNLIYSLFNKQIKKHYFDVIINWIVIVVFVSLITYLNNWSWKEFSGQILFGIFIFIIIERMKKKR